MHKRGTGKNMALVYPPLSTGLKKKTKPIQTKPTNQPNKTNQTNRTNRTNRTSQTKPQTQRRTADPTLLTASLAAAVSNSQDGIVWAKPYVKAGSQVVGPQEPSPPIRPIRWVVSLGRTGGETRGPLRRFEKQKPIKTS